MNTTGRIMLNRGMVTKDGAGNRHSLQIWIEADNIVAIEQNICTDKMKDGRPLNEEYPIIVSLKHPFWQQESNEPSMAIMVKESAYDIQTRIMLHTDDID